MSTGIYLTYDRVVTPNLNASGLKQQLIEIVDSSRQ